MNKKIIADIESALAEIEARENRSGHDNNLAGALSAALALAQEGDALREVKPD